MANIALFFCIKRSYTQRKLYLEKYEIEDSKVKVLSIGFIRLTFTDLKYIGSVSEINRYYYI